MIRPEKARDEAAIEAVTIAAFATAPRSDGTEQHIVRRLRDSGGLAVSLVAEEDGDIIGHIAFSEVTVDGNRCGWYGLGPVSVRPDLQRKGIGSLLVRAGLDALGSLGANGCVLLGNPAFYGRFGFTQREGLTLPGVPASHFLGLPLREAAASGIVAYHPGFYGEV